VNPYDEFLKRPFDRPHSLIERAADAVGLNRFFLREGRRPHFRAGDDEIVSPVHGVLKEIQTLRSDSDVHGKTSFGHHEDYTFEEIVHGTEMREAFDSGFCFNLYLSPLRLHYALYPTDLTVKRMVYHRAFCRPIVFMRSGEIHNERLVVYAETGRGVPMILILVGSFLVSGIECLAEAGGAYRRGELWGGFKLGSTVLMLIPRDYVEPLVQPGSRVLLGEPLARFI